MSDEVKFVTIELNRKQVDTEHLTHNEKTNKDYARVFAPGGGVLFYPVESIKSRKDNPERVYFSRPEGTELRIYYSRRKEGVPDDAPNSEKYEKHTETLKIEELKAQYEGERRDYAANHGFANMTVPTAWGHHFNANDENGTPMVSISIPISENGTDTYWSFILAADRFRESTKENGMSYFGFPKKNKEGDSDYMVRLKTGDRQEDGTYKDRYMEISSMKLKEYVEAAKERSQEKYRNKDASTEEAENVASKGANSAEETDVAAEAETPDKVNAKPRRAHGR